MALFSYPVCTWLCQYVNMGVRKWLEKSAEKQKYKMRKTANPLSRKAFRAVSFSATKDKKKDTLSACLSFWVLRAVGPTPLRRFKCSADVNSASAKVLPAAKHPHGALVPPARRPVGWSTHTFSGFQNTNMNAPSKEKDIRIGCPSLSFCPPEAAQAASLLWRNFLDKRGRTL